MAHNLRLCSFNVLAPSARICKPLDRITWRARHEAICETILGLKLDVVCLQEFDFATATRGFAKLYQDKLGATFELFLKQRTGGKQEGLAMLIRRECFDNVEVTNLELEPHFCDRVAIVVKMKHIMSGMQLLVGNTHLTVAHASNGHDIPMCRPAQMEEMLQHMRTASSGTGCAVFLCGDMNSDHLETEPSGRYAAAEVSRPITMAFEQGFSSALHTAHPLSRPISHTCSYAQDGCADYIFFQPSEDLALGRAFLHPEELPLDTPWDASTGWDSQCSSILPSTLSDHRPLVVDFQIAARAVRGDTYEPSVAEQGNDP